MVAHSERVGWAAQAANGHAASAEKPVLYTQDSCRVKREKKNVKIIRGAYNGDKITVMDGGEQWVIDGEVGGYGSVPSYLAPPTVVSSLIMEKIYRPGSAEIDINAVPLKNLNGKSE